ncbi:MAG: adenylate kinase family protein [Methanolinea sp.]|nr:adenylate kinase family protein [Methanolinea sp.]
MMVGITGTPGTGKSSIGRILSHRGYHVTEIGRTTAPYILGKDEQRDSLVIDEEKWACEFPAVEGFVIGHLAHLLACDKVVVLRCDPGVLAVRLRHRGYGEEKVRENCEAEALDVILIETLELFPGEKILELDTTNQSPDESADIIEQFVRGEIPGRYGGIDWTGYLEGGP